MIWSPRSVIDASPCSNDNIIDAKIPANRPSQTDPVIAANAAETKAAAKVFLQGRYQKYLHVQKISLPSIPTTKVSRGAMSYLKPEVGLKFNHSFAFRRDIKKLSSGALTIKLRAPVNSITRA